MILTVTLNAALDVTYDVARLVPRGSHRVERTHERAGGKGVNVARVLSALGRPATVTGLVGGPTGQLLRGELSKSTGLVDEFVDIAGESRRTVTVVSRADGDATVFNQSGPTVSAAEWEGFTARFRQLVSQTRVVVLSGSLPPGVPTDGYGQLVRLAVEAGDSGRGARTVLDTSGAALLAALPAGPDIIKPNTDELTVATGESEPSRASQALRAQGARTVVASAGPAGLYALTPHGAWWAAPPHALSGNPTGAGDACVAALAGGLADGASDGSAGRERWPALLREAVALSAAAVVRPVAGDFDPAVHRSFRDRVTVRAADG